MKKAYKTPVLTVFGDVVNLTQGQGHGSGQDLAFSFIGRGNSGYAGRGNKGYGGPGSLSGT